MKVFDELESKGWYKYGEGCSCLGRDRPYYFNHLDYPGYIITTNLRTDKFNIKLEGKIVASGEGKEELESKLKEYGLVEE